MNGWSARYRTDPSEPWRSTTLVMRQDYEDQQFDNLTLVAGSWPEGNDIAIERTSQAYYGLDIGDKVYLDLETTDRQFEITGRVRHPFVPPPDFGGDTHFIVSDDVIARFGLPKGQFTQLLIQIENHSDEYARDRMAAVRDHLAKQGVGVMIAIFQEPEEHWGRPFMLGMTFVLRVLAVLALLTSVILVINTMTAVITQQVDQIGIIKAIGGRSSDITKVYLAGVAVYGFLALIVALPLGMGMAFGASQALLNIFNIDYETFAFSNRAVLFQVLAALVAPMVAALGPVLRGATMSVREAIASYGLGGDFGSNRFDQWIERNSQKILSSPYAIAIGNMFRKKGRLMLTQAVLVLAGGLFILVLTLANSVTNTLENELARREYDMRIVFAGQPKRSDTLEEIALRYPNVTAVEGWLTMTGNVLKDGELMRDSAALGTELFGIPVGSEMYEPNIVSGRWLEPDETGNVAVVSQAMADFNNFELGDPFTVNMGDEGEIDLTIIGTYIAIAPDPFTSDPVYVPEPALVEATKKINRARHLLVQVEPSTPELTRSIMDAMFDEFEQKNFAVLQFLTRTVHEERDFANEQFAILNNLLFGLSAVMAIVGGVGLMGALSISVMERTKEIGVLRAIGAKTPVVAGMFVMEGILQGVMSWAIAVPLAYVTSRPMALALGRILLDTELDFAFSWAAVGGWFAAVVVIATLASLLPARNASRISVRESLAYG